MISNLLSLLIILLTTNCWSQDIFSPTEIINIKNDKNSKWFPLGEYHWRRDAGPQPSDEDAMWSATDRGIAISKDGRGAYAFRMSVVSGGTSVNVTWNVYLYNYRRENIGKFTIYAAVVIVGPGLKIPVRHLLNPLDKPLDIIKDNFDQIAYVGVEDIRVTMYFEEKDLDPIKREKRTKKAWKALHKVKRIVPFED